jgi:DNA-binding response OmpR family regulator
MSDVEPRRAAIVLIEDAPDVLRLLTRFIGRLVPDATLITGGTGAEALAHLGDQPLTLGIVDYRLPGANGLTIVEMLKTTIPTARIILITASPSDALEQRAVAAGIDAFLPKPFTFAELEQVVRAVLPVG